MEEEMPTNKPIEGNYTPVIKDIMYLSIALDKAWQQSERAIERIETAPEPRMITQQDYEDTLAAAKARMAELKKKEGAKAVG
jgi:hypothetical protein